MLELDLEGFSLDEPGPRGYKTFSCSTQLSTIFILLINVKMPTIYGLRFLISPEKLVPLVR